MYDVVIFNRDGGKRNICCVDEDSGPLCLLVFLWVLWGLCGIYAGLVISSVIKFIEMRSRHNCVSKSNPGDFVT